MSEFSCRPLLSDRGDLLFAARLEAVVLALLVEHPAVDRVTLWGSSSTLSLLASSYALPEGFFSPRVEVFAAFHPGLEEGTLRVEAAAEGVRVPAVEVFDVPMLSAARYEVCVRLRSDGTPRARALELAGELA